MKRPPKTDKLRPVLTVLFWFYLAVLFRITVFRNSCFSYGWCSGRVVWTPFAYLLHLIRIGYWRYFLYLFIGNLIWFMPLGCYLAGRGRPFWQTVLAGFLLSVLIEALQYLLGSGVTETEDVILNTCGTMLGCGLTSLFVKKNAA